MFFCSREKYIQCDVLDADERDGDVAGIITPHDISGTFSTARTSHDRKHLLHDLRVIRCVKLGDVWTVLERYQHLVQQVEACVCHIALRVPVCDTRGWYTLSSSS